jgi:hypothetical protein
MIIVRGSGSVTTSCFRTKLSASSTSLLNSSTNSVLFLVRLRGEFTFRRLTGGSVRESVPISRTEHSRCRITRKAQLP